jgi:hypothetical protein
MPWWIGYNLRNRKNREGKLDVGREDIWVFVGTKETEGLLMGSPGLGPDTSVGLKDFAGIQSVNRSPLNKFGLNRLRYFQVTGKCCLQISDPIYIYRIQQLPGLYRFKPQDTFAQRPQRPSTSFRSTNGWYSDY